MAPRKKGAPGAEDVGKDAEAAGKAADKAKMLETVEELGAAQCSPEDVAIIMGWGKRKEPLKPAELQAAYQKGRVKGLKDLRRAQLRMANRSVSMATMLGRIYLGQSEQREQDGSTPIDYAAVAERNREKGVVPTDPGGATTD